MEEWVENQSFTLYVKCLSSMKTLHQKCTEIPWKFKEVIGILLISTLGCTWILIEQQSNQQYNTEEITKISNHFFIITIVLSRRNICPCSWNSIVIDVLIIKRLPNTISK